MISTEIITLSNPTHQYLNYVNPTIGMFFMMGGKDNCEGISFAQCRDSVALYWATIVPVKGTLLRIGYSLNKRGPSLDGIAIGPIESVLDIPKINVFFAAVSSKLGIPEPVFYHTQLAGTMILDVPEFWRTSLAAESVFTLLLRCAAVYYDPSKGVDTVSKAIRAYPLANNVWKAVERFLDGYTNLVGTAISPMNAIGFVKVMNDKNDSQIATMLVKP